MNIFKNMSYFLFRLIFSFYTIKTKTKFYYQTQTLVQKDPKCRFFRILEIEYYKSSFFELIVAGVTFLFFSSTINFFHFFPLT